MDNGRVNNSIRNICAGAVGQGIYIALNFAVRTVFLYTLTREFAGINGLLASVLTILSLADIGIDGAIVYAMYKPLAENDFEKTKSLLALYRKAYRIIGAVIFAVGVALIPALPYLAKGSTDLVDLRIIYLLYLLETACSYWFFSYLSSVITAAQKQYVISLVRYFIDTGLAVVRIVLLLLLRSHPALSFYIYTVLGTIFGITKNLCIRVRCRKLFPWVAEKNALPLPKNEKQDIFKNVAGMFTNNVCRVLNDGIDSAIISAMLGVSLLAVYGNYLTIRSYVYQVVRTILDPLCASVGNLCAVESTEKKENFFYSLQFTCFWIYGFCAISLWILLDPFIAGVWLRDESWLLPGFSVLLVAVNFLVEGLAKAVVIYRDANGLFWQTRYRYIFSSLFNVGVSILLVGPAGLGVTGALLGTTASVLLMVSYDPVLVYREVFHKKAGSYYLLYLKDLLLIAATGALVWLCALPFRAFTVGDFFIRLLLCLVIPNGLWFLLFRRTPEFRYLYDTAFRLLQRLLERLKKS